jgi:periplasmic protein TonB
MRWLFSFGVVVLAHLTAGSIVIWWSTPSSANEDLTADAIMLELAAAPEAPPSPPTDLPPGPLQQPQERPVQAVRQQSAPVVDLPTFDHPEVQDPSQTIEQPEGAQADERMQAQAPPNVSAAPSTRLAAQQTVSGVQAAVAVTWQGVLLGHLERHRRYPRQAERLRQEGTAYVRFTVDQRGHVANAAIHRSSGNPLLDEATLDTLRRASPVPPPPSELAPYPVDVMVPVEFYIRRQ